MAAFRSARLEAAIEKKILDCVASGIYLEKVLLVELKIKAPNFKYTSMSLRRDIFFLLSSQNK